jgi:hypothetical protein
MADAAPAPVVDATGAILEDDARRAAGLAALRAAMDAAAAAAAAAAPGSAAAWRAPPRSDDRFLLAFLRTAKYDVPKAMARLGKFTAFWYGNPDLINGLCADAVRPYYGDGMMQLLGGSKDALGNTVTVLRMGALDPAKFSPIGAMKLSVYMLAAVFDRDDLQLHGGTYVESMEGFSLSASFALSRTMGAKDQQKMMTLATDTFPMRVRDIYLIHQPWYFTLFWKLVSPFLPRKLTKRLHLLGGDLSALHAAVPPAGLPRDFGGTLDEPLTQFLDDMAAKEAATGMIGGFAFPLAVDDPTGEARRAQAAAAAAAAAAGGGAEQ